MRTNLIKISHFNLQIRKFSPPQHFVLFRFVSRHNLNCSDEDTGDEGAFSDDCSVAGFEGGGSDLVKHEIYKCFQVDTLV